MIPGRFLSALSRCCLALGLGWGGSVANSAHAETQTTGLVELFEMHVGEDVDQMLFSTTFVTGGERHGATLMVDGGGDVGPRLEEVIGHLLYTLNPQGNQQLLIGIRQDFRDGPDLSHAALGVSVNLGTVLSAEHYLYLSEKGNVTGSAEVVSYIKAGPAVTIEPRVSIGWAPADIRAEDTGAGLTDMAAALRVRRQLGPVFNLYAGVIHERLLGRTRVIASANGDTRNTTRLIIGMGASF
ncbi:copper resistance protein B [Novosphingobium colocasiae]|uniref:copper resistance protein B n=1 Tax=Novosphingobium colocasiae TaxID=1256513 RepID=UPI0035B2EC6A